MTLVNVTTPGGNYPIHIQSGRLGALDTAIPADATAIALVSNATVLARYGQRVRQALGRTGKPLVEVVLPDGEAHKT